MLRAHISYPFEDSHSPIYQQLLQQGDRREARLAKLLHLEEVWDRAIENFAKHQGVVKRWFNHRAKIKTFRIADLVMYWDKVHEKKGGHKKLDNFGLAPFK